MPCTSVLGALLVRWGECGEGGGRRAVLRDKKNVVPCVALAQASAGNKAALFIQVKV